jgi:hypothetical protein
LRGANMYERREVLKRGLFIHPSIMGRTAWFRSNPYDPSFRRSQDYELWCRTVATSRFAQLDARLMFYRQPDGFDVAAYYVNCHANRAVIRRHGPSAIGPWASRALLAQTYLKEAIYRLAAAGGQAHILVRAREEPLSDGERAEYRRLISHVLSTPVPVTPVPGVNGFDTVPL